MESVTISIERYDELKAKAEKMDRLFKLKKDYHGQYHLTISERDIMLHLKELLDKRTDLEEYEMVCSNYDPECLREINGYNMYAAKKESELVEDGQESIS